MKQISRLSGVTLASFIVSAMLVTAAAQTATSQTPIQNFGPDTGVWAERIGVEKIAEGVWASTEEAQMLREYGCALKPLGLVRDFLARMAEKGHSPCSTKWYQGLGKVNKEGSMLSLIKLSFGGYLVAESDKGINLTPNHGQFTLYTLDSRSVGRPVLTDYTAAPSGDMVVADIAKTAIGATLNSSGAAVIHSLVNPCNKGGCGGGPQVINNNNVDGGNASAVNQNHNGTSVGVTITDGCSGCGLPKD